MIKKEKKQTKNIQKQKQILKVGKENKIISKYATSNLELLGPGSCRSVSGAASANKRKRGHLGGKNHTTAKSKYRQLNF